MRREWGVGVNEVGGGVVDVMRKRYGDYRIDDGDYVERGREWYYVVEVEGGEKEVDVGIVGKGRIV